MVKEILEMEEAAVAVDGRNFYRLISSSSPRKPSVRGVIRESDGALIHSQERQVLESTKAFYLARGTLGLPFMPASDSM